MKIVNLTMTAMDKLRAARDNKLGTSVSAFGAGPRKRDKKGAALRLRNYQSDLETHEAIEEINEEIKTLEVDRAEFRASLRYKSYSKEDLLDQIKKVEAEIEAKNKAGDEDDDEGPSPSPIRSKMRKRGPQKKAKK